MLHRMDIAYAFAIINSNNKRLNNTTKYYRGNWPLKQTHIANSNNNSNTNNYNEKKKCQANTIAQRPDDIHPNSFVMWSASLTLLTGNNFISNNPQNKKQDISPEHDAAVYEQEEWLHFFAFATSCREKNQSTIHDHHCSRRRCRCHRPSIPGFWDARVDLVTNPGRGVWMRRYFGFSVCKVCAFFVAVLLSNDRE